MDPSRKRRIRLGVALSVAVLLASALAYTSFSAATQAREPSDLMTLNPDQTVDLTGKVVEGTVERDGVTLRFEIADRDDQGGESVPVAYEGTVPDPFREGREVIVTGSMEGETFVAERDSLITKCPSKFEKDTESGT